MTAISSPILDTVRRERGRRAAFRAAQRHSRRVRLLRLLVPAAGVLAVLLVIGTWWHSIARAPDLAVTDVTMTTDGIAMDAPVLRGEDDAGRPYTLRAREAYQTLSTNPVFTLLDLQGDMMLDDGEAVFLRAPQARFDSATGLARFEEGAVELTLSSGGQAFLGVTQVDLDAGTIASDERVAVATGEVTLEAGGMQAFDAGERLLFTGGVYMVVRPDREARGAAATPQAPEQRGTVTQ